MKAFHVFIFASLAFIQVACMSGNHCITGSLTPEPKTRRIAHFSSVSLEIPRGYHKCNRGKPVAGYSVSICLVFAKCREPTLDAAVADALYQSNKPTDDLSDVRIAYGEFLDIFLIIKYYLVVGVPLCKDASPGKTPINSIAFTRE